MKLIGCVENIEKEINLLKEQVSILNEQISLFIALAEGNSDSFKSLKNMADSLKDLIELNKKEINSIREIAIRSRSHGYGNII